MAEARGRDRWAHTSTILAMIANVNRDPKKSRPFKPQDFSPYRPVRKGPRKKVPLSFLRDVFVKEKKGDQGQRDRAREA